MMMIAVRDVLIRLLVVSLAGSVVAGCVAEADTSPASPSIVVDSTSELSVCPGEYLRSAGFPSGRDEVNDLVVGPTTSATLCVYPPQLNSGGPRELAQELLIDEGAGPLAEEINAMPTAANLAGESGDGACLAAAAPTYLVIFFNEDSLVATVEFDPACGMVRSGNAYRRPQENTILRWFGL